MKLVMLSQREFCKNRTRGSTLCVGDNQEDSYRFAEGPRSYKRLKHSTFFIAPNRSRLLNCTARRLTAEDTREEQLTGDS